MWFSIQHVGSAPQSQRPSHWPVPSVSWKVWTCRTVGLVGSWELFVAEKSWTGGIPLGSCKRMKKLNIHGSLDMYTISYNRIVRVCVIMYIYIIMIHNYRLYIHHTCMHTCCTDRRTDRQTRLHAYIPTCIQTDIHTISSQIVSQVYMLWYSQPSIPKLQHNHWEIWTSCLGCFVRRCVDVRSAGRKPF